MASKVDLLAVADMKQRMKQIVHKRLRSVRESVLRQRNENYAQKCLFSKSHSQGVRVVEFCHQPHHAVIEALSWTKLDLSWIC